MDLDAALYDFMDVAKDDPCIGPSHISLYLAILYLNKEHEFEKPVSVYSRELMKQAKISAIGTYHKCIRDLKDAGYIKYIPSYNPVLGSMIYLIKQHQ